MHFGYRLCSNSTSALGAATQDRLHFTPLLFPFLTTCTDRLQQGLQVTIQTTLEHAVAKTAATIVLLQFFQGKAIRFEGIEEVEHDVAFDLSRIIHAQVIGIGVHALYGLFDFIGRSTQRNRVAERLAHLGLAVDTRQAPCSDKTSLHSTRISLPTTLLKRRTSSLVCSIIGNWSLPTGTRLALKAVISAAWLTG